MRVVCRGRGAWLAAFWLSLAVSAPAAPGRQRGPAAPAPGSRVLVLPFVTDVDPGTAGGPAAALWLGEAAAILLAEQLDGVGFLAVPREDRVALFDRLRLPTSATLTRATMIRVGELVGASEVVFGRLRLGASLVARVEAIQLHAGRGLAPIVDEAALAAASAVPADAPESRRARFAAALSLIELRRYDGADLALRALAAERSSAAAWNALGVVALRRTPAGAGEPPAARFARAVAGAVQAVREALRRNMADADAHLVLSTLLQASGRPGEAMRELELGRMLGLAQDPPPTAPLAVVPRGLERITSEPDRSVIAALDGAPSFLWPHDSEPHLALGTLYQRAGRLQEAIDEFKVAVWCRETAAARVALGAALLESGDRDAARREAERALVLAPGSADARALLRQTGGGLVRTTVLTSAASA